ncbi:MAG TPA: M56 family metallopeptidase, partial [Phenylobacterium sp.]
MASEILSGLVRANLWASAAVIVVLALRTPVARRLGARAAYALWVAAPLAGAACLIPARVITLHQTAAGVREAATAMRASYAPSPVALSHLTSDLFGTSLGVLATAVWALGAILWAAAVVWRQHQFHRALGPLRREAGVYRAQAAGVGPVLMGAFRPRIVVPADFEARFTAEEQVVVLAHEEAHLRAGDHLVNVAVAGLQGLCWFNPLAHIAAHCLRVDQELACDAAVLARHPRARRVYGEAMLKTQFAGLAAPLACQWPAVGPNPLKRRIAMLRAAAPSAPRRLAGLALAAAFSLGAGVAAWAAQPPQVQTVI